MIIVSILKKLSNSFSHHEGMEEIYKQEYLNNKKLILYGFATILYHSVLRVKSLSQCVTSLKRLSSVCFRAV